MADAAGVQRPCQRAQLPDERAASGRDLVVAGRDESPRQLPQAGSLHRASREERLQRQAEPRLLAQEYRRHRRDSEPLKRQRHLPFPFCAGPAEAREKRIPDPPKPVPLGVEPFAFRLDLEDGSDRILLDDSGVGQCPFAQIEHPVDQRRRRPRSKPPREPVLPSDLPSDHTRHACTANRTSGKGRWPSPVYSFWFPVSRQCRRWDSNPHGHKAHGFLKPARMPIPPLRPGVAPHGRVRRKVQH